ncbi:MAG: sigma-54-dependent Fis family transcriptional regulator [Acidobacteria bacterium]|uniref:Sigma-54-dependent Fis family transcriptional regulator n=1 Tax=Candidatus Polarisedimenticola svalbardensis TaxID=2886004 RepID=A0A8J6Y2Y9_9BACT|nr:sigma-54-dependent Fis family transcriptional regulator [Candidatus Polarisedimenticola svalbardensis]
MPHILIVDDEANVRKVLGTLLQQGGYQTTPAGDAAQALDLVRAQDPDLVLTDLQMPGMDGMELLSTLRADFPEIPVVMLTAHGSIEAAVEAMKLGAFDFMTKPFDREQVLEVIGKALGQAARSRLEWQDGCGQDDCGLVGGSGAMESVRSMIRKVADSPTTVLVTGETGTGKELVADALHRLSRRAGKALVKINCGALPENLVESELFGHERGAFTGADRARPGRFELADGGTLFLDEVGELPPPVQVKLLRVLQEQVVDRVGGSSPLKVDVRLVAATHRNLKDEVREGRFREDLLYRLQVVQLHAPALRERPEDIPELTRFFLSRQAERLQRSQPQVSDPVLSALAARDWPGNVRELQNAAERAVLLGDGPELTLEDFIPAEPGAPSPTPGSSRPAGDLKTAARAAAAETERRMISAALQQTGGNVTQAAEQLGLSRRGLQLKMKELGLRN